MARQFPLALVLPDGKVLMAGGGIFQLEMVALAELYDPATGTWNAAGTLHDGRIFHTMTLLSNGKVLVVGGVGTGGVLQSAELYDPATRQWRRTGELATKRLFHTATLLPNGKVLVAGGSSEFDTHDETSLNSAELYDPVTEQWLPAGHMSLPRGGHAALTLPNGKILLAGGSNGEELLHSTDIYDPDTGTWTEAADLHFPRVSHSATLLHDGRILIAGGAFEEGNGLHVLDTAELYGTALLTLNATAYCTGDSWNLKVVDAIANASIHLMGTTNGISWDVQGWAKTDANGNYTEIGTFHTSAAGNHALRVKIGNYLSIPILFNVKSC
jgi:hypothetical protein